MVLSLSDAKKVCERSYASPDQQFITANAPQVQVSCNLWFAVMQDAGIPDGYIGVFKQTLIASGLTATCTWCRELADSLLAESEEVAVLNLQHFWSKHSHDNTLSGLFTIVSEQITRNRTTEAAFAATLQVLLFLERFTFKNGNPETSIKKFVTVNAKCREYEYDWTIWPRQATLCFIREELDAILSGDFTIDPMDCGFTNGSTNSTRADYLQKWKFLSHIMPNYKGFVQYPLLDGFFGKRINKYPKLMGVPKTFSDFRIIAPEDPVINYWATAALAALRRCLGDSGACHYINEHDQDVNRALAEIGSLEGGIATIDMSAASDSISKAIFFAVCPPRLRSLYAEYSSDYCILPSGVPKKLFTLFTSGHPLTWLTEACYFLAIARVGTRLAGYDDYRDLCYAYGDDLIVPSGAYETVRELLELCGHTVNGRKSFSYGGFRESCGGWYMNGIDVTPIHWPRRVVNPKNHDLAAAVVTIQHHAYLSTWKMDRLIQCCNETACKLEPTMTYSYLFAESEDLWDPDLDPMTSDISRHWVVVREEKPRKREPFLDHLVYYQYLEHGPLYYDGLAELLRTSTSRFETYKTFGESSSRLR